MKFKLFLIFNFLLVAAYIKCAHTPPAEEVHIRSYEDKRKKDGNILITYKNTSGSISLSLDPYDEDLYIEMEGGNFDSVSKALTSPMSSQNEHYSNDKEKHQTYSGTQIDSIINVIKELLSQNQSNNEKKERASQESAQSPSQDIKDTVNSIDTLEVNNVNDSTVRNAIAEIRIAQEKFYKQEYSEALEHIDNSLSMYETAENLALKGSILFMMNKQLEAGEFWKKALDINPDMPGIKNMMRLIDNEELAH